MTAARAPAMDLGVLDAQTGGDRGLENDVLRLFLDRIPSEIARLRTAGPDAAVAVAHGIVGSARAVGAGGLAAAAAAIEADGDVRPAALARLEEEFAEVERFIAAHRGRPE